MNRSALSPVVRGSPRSSPRPRGMLFHRGFHACGDEGGKGVYVAVYAGAVEGDQIGVAVLNADYGPRVAIPASALGLSRPAATQG